MAGVKPLLETIGALLPRIKALHVSPHDFEKFDISKIGTGQGAASYGEGIYKAESPKVSGQGGEYWKEFLQRFSGAEREAANTLRANDFNREQAIAELNKAVNTMRAGVSGFGEERFAEQYRRMLPLYEQQLKLLESGKPVGPRVYETAIHAKPEQILDWDKPLSAQPSQPWKRLDPLTREVIDERTAARGSNAMGDALEAYTGKELYQALKSDAVQDVLPAEVGRSSWLKGDTTPAFHTMQYLNSIDLPVTRYADAMSRNPVVSKAAQDAVQRNLERFAKARESGAPQWEQDYYREAVQTARDRKQRELDAFPRTYNYVTRDTDFLEILRKLAIPGMLTGGAASVYQPQGQQ